MARIINSIGNTTIQKYIQADDEYDRMTRNGETEGAAIYRDKAESIKVKKYRFRKNRQRVTWTGRIRQKKGRHFLKH